MSDGDFPSFPISGEISGQSGDDDNGSTFPSFLTPDSGSDTGSSGDTGERFDPNIHIARDRRNANGSYTRKRGRKSGGGGGTSSRKANTAASVEALTRTLIIVHIGLAAATKAPEMVLEESEADALAKSTANVLEQFDIRPDPKIEAVVGLLMTAGSIYGPRAWLIRERLKSERQ